MTRPASEPRPQNPTAVVAFVRTQGSIRFDISSVPADFVAWRRELRQEAKKLDIRLSVMRQVGSVWVLNPDYEPSQDVMRAAMEVLGSVLTDQTVDFDDAVQRQRRSRMRLVQDDAGADGSDGK
jgi:hypothetical protein